MLICPLSLHFGLRLFPKRQRRIQRRDDFLLHLPLDQHQRDEGFQFDAIGVPISRWRINKTT